MVLRKDGFCVIILCQSIYMATSCALQATTDIHSTHRPYGQIQTPTDTTSGQLVYSLNGNVASNCQHDKVKQSRKRIVRKKRRN